MLRPWDVGGFLHLFSLYCSSEYSNESTCSVLRKQDSDGLSFQECPGNVVVASLELFPLANIPQIVVGAPWLKDTLFTYVQLGLGVLFSCSPVCAGLCLCVHWASWGSYQPVPSACRSTWIYLPPCQPFSPVWFQRNTCEGYILSVTHKNVQNFECFWFQNWIRILRKHQRSKLSPLAPKDAVRRAWSGLMCYILGAVHLPKTNTSTHKLRFVLPLLIEIRVVIITTPKLSRSLDCRHLTSESRILLLSDGSSQQNWWSSGCF